MNLILSVCFLLIIIFSVFEKKHKLLVFLIVLSVFTDVFTFQWGPVVHLSNVIGFITIPFIQRFYINKNVAIVSNKIKYILKPLWLNLFYLFILGIIFGFLIPWDDTSGHRTWSQQAPGRTIITLIRYLNELCIALYLIWTIVLNKVKLKFIITVIGWIVVISCLIGILEYISGFPIIRALIQEKPKILIDRFLGLCGEPKAFGRNAALAYIVIFSYYLKIDKQRKYLLFILFSALTVILSLSASTFILFAIFNIYILIETRKVQLLLWILPIALGGFFLLNNNPIFTEAKGKIEKALFGTDQMMTYGADSSVAMNVISRFDIFDHLAYVFLLNNPGYFLSGTGPNLISIPASKYVGDFIQYNSYAETGGIDSVPNVMFNNILASSGLVGIFLYTLFFLRLYRFSKVDDTGFSKNLVVISIVFSMVYFSFVLLFLTGIILGITCRIKMVNIMSHKVNYT